MKRKETIEQRLQREREYLQFLKKRIESKNYRSAVGEEEYEKTREKYKKAKLIVKILDPRG
jgi:hypothetical protein